MNSGLRLISMPLNGTNRVRPSSALLSASSGATSTADVGNVKLELLISCENLPKLDAFSSSDAVCVIFLRRFGRWSEYKRTECIVNCLKPKFTESCLLDISELEDQNFRFVVYNMENMTSKDLHQHQEIGFVEVMMSELLERDTAYTANLKGQMKNAGTITITAEKVNENSLKETVNFCIAAHKLATKKLFGKCACFVEISRMLSTGHYQPIYRSEIVSKNAEPRWRPFQVSLQKICNGDRSCNIAIAVWNYRNKGEHELLGECHVTLDKLLKCAGGVKLLPISKAESGKMFSVARRSSNNSSGAVQILQCYVNEQFSLVDYVKGGCSINFMAAVDFSLSNGYPMEEDSLHFVGQKKSNVYADALYEVGSLLAYYELNQAFPLYGFGGCLEESESGQHYFQISGAYDLSSPAGNGIQNLVEAYKNVLPNIRPKGPTCFTPILRKFTEGIKEAADQGDQTYTFGLILTDGVCNDEEEFVSELIKARNLPFSIVVVGVGLLDCLSLQVLADKVKKKAKRSMIYFIPFRQPDTGLYDSRQVRWTYAQLSKDTVDYFKDRAIKPGKADGLTRRQSAWAEKDFASTMTEPFKESVDANLNHIIDRTSFCPTCGNHGPVNF